MDADHGFEGFVALTVADLLGQGFGRVIDVARGSPQASNFKLFVRDSQEDGATAIIIIGAREAQQKQLTRLNGSPSL